MEDTMTLAIERVLPGGPDTLAPDSASIAAHWQRCYDSVDTDSELLATYRDAAMVVAASIF